MSDYETPEVFEKKIRKARKDHVCGECGRTIKTGESYENASGLWDGSWGRCKTCAHCLTCRPLATNYWGEYGYGDLENAMDCNHDGSEEWDSMLSGLRSKWTNEDGSLMPIPSKETIRRME